MILGVKKQQESRNDDIFCYTVYTVHIIYNNCYIITSPYFFIENTSNKQIRMHTKVQTNIMLLRI